MDNWANPIRVLSSGISFGPTPDFLKNQQSKRASRLKPNMIISYQRKRDRRKWMILEKLVQIGRDRDHIDSVDQLSIDKLVWDLVDRVFIGQELEFNILEFFFLVAHS